MKQKVNFPLAIALIIFCGVLLVVVVLQCGFNEPSKQPSDQITEDETADWQTYKNEAYGYEIKYPGDFPSPEVETDWDVYKSSAVLWGMGLTFHLSVGVYYKELFTEEEWNSLNDYYEKYDKIGEVFIEGQNIPILELDSDRKAVHILRDEYLYRIMADKDIDFLSILSTFRFIEIEVDLQRFRHFPKISSWFSYYDECDNGDIPSELNSKIKEKSEDISGDLEYPRWRQYSICEINLDDDKETREFLVGFASPSQRLPFLIYQNIYGSWKGILEDSFSVLGIEEDKTNGYYNIIISGHMSAGMAEIEQYKWNSSISMYEQNKEWSEEWGYLWLSSEF